MGRTEDQIIIDALVAATYNTTATDDQGFEIAHGSAGFTTAKLRSLKKYYVDLDVDEDALISLAISGSGLESLLGNTETTSSDYNTIKALVQGTLNTFMGFDFVTIGGRRAEGGLGGSGLISYSWVNDSVGLAAASLERSQDVSWVSERSSWLCNGMLKAGAVIIDPEGTGKINFQ